MFSLMFRNRRLRVVTMIIAKSTIVLLIFVLTLSILVANVTDFINVESHSTYDKTGVPRMRQSGTTIKYPKYYNIGRSYDHLMWFLQISDLHLSIFRDVFRISEFQEFCNVTVDSIKPAVVVASGDLTDAIAKDRFGSKQILLEWRSYKYVMDVTNIKEKTLWLDVRGNHDNFNMISLDSKYNYYSNYSIQGTKHPRSYMYNVTVGSEKYSFIAVDACLKPGPKRPFNFIGLLDQHEINVIKQLIKQSQKIADHAIVFGHYPTSCIVSRADTDIRSLLGNYRENMAYLCGHYHTFAGVVPNMYTLQNGDFLELELADWKDNRMYRLAAIDHGQFSFIDIRHNDWPVVLITNPKNVQFRMPQRENPKSAITSTHVRVLAFSTVPVRTVEIQFDKRGDWLPCEHVEGPLYVLPWNATAFSHDIHYVITARVIDMENREKIVSHDFSLRGLYLTFRVLPKLILTYSVVHIFQIAFYVLWLITIVPLCILRYIHLYRKRRRMYRPRMPNTFCCRLVRRLWVLSTIDKVFFTLVLYSVYIVLGPWSVGEVIDGHIGVIFVWGIYVANTYLPGGITYFYGCMHMFFFNFVLTLFLSILANSRLEEIEHPTRERMSNILPLMLRVLFICMLLISRLVSVYSFYLEYGILAALLCPLHIGGIAIAIILYFYIQTMPSSCLSSAAAMWCRREAVNGNIPGTI